ncbi:MAG: guanylate kinase [Armatimonadetes bacterium]|nr:guanylate kinase [Armatimonadota bacterium]MDW8120991.1 guanylate kinase [Armatimonadota bacterium]
MQVEATKRGRLLVVSGPSGAGKGTLVARALECVPSVRRVITYTTRPPRPNEQDGCHYHFVTQNEFEQMKKDGAFLEWAMVYDHAYGSPRNEVESLLEKGTDVVLVLDVQGALSVKGLYPESTLIFILPPSTEELEKRIRRRGADPEEAIQKRLEMAANEMAQTNKFDILIVNDELDKAVAQLIAVFKGSYVPCGAVGENHPCEVTDEKLDSLK